MQEDFRFESYHYKPLPTESCIRLLRQVKNDSPAQPKIFDHNLLHFTIDVVSINDDVEYEALSYTWGSPTVPTVDNARKTSDDGKAYTNQRFPIGIDGKLVFVTSNLYDALQQLCGESQSAVLIDDRYPPYGKSKLVLEAEADNVHEVANLIAQGADINLQDHFGDTALHYAAENSFLETVELLLDAGANANLEDCRQRTALDCCMEARRRQHVEVEKLLRTRCNDGAPVKPVDVRPSTRKRIDRKWIDALCINQNDVDERNSQVSQIHKVYQHAARVAIWLGKLDDRKDLELVYPQPFDLNWFRFNLEIISYHVCTWFRRVWTVQEAAMARDLRMLYGSHELTLMHPDIVPKPTQAAVIHNRAVDLRLGTGMDLWAQRNPDRIIHGPTISSLTKFNRLEEQQHQHTWTSILAMTFNLEATDPRDKIFALRGLVPSAHGSARVDVDYTCDIAQLYSQIGREFILGDCIERCRPQPAQYTTSSVPTKTQRRYATTLDGLGYNQRSTNQLADQGKLATIGSNAGSQQLNDLGLPTWCPDFRFKTRSALVDYLGSDATRGTKPKFYPSEAHVLKLDAALFDKVVEIETMDHLRGLNAHQRRAGLVHGYAKILLGLKRGHKNRYPTTQSRAMALIKTLIMSPYPTNTCACEDTHTNPDTLFATNEKQALMLWIAETDATGFKPSAINNRSTSNKGINNSVNPDNDSEIAEELSFLHELCTSLEPRAKLSRLNDIKLMPQLLQDLHREHLTRRSGRILFLTEQGYLGLGLQSTNVGDEVVLLGGGHVPYVLRQIQTEDNRAEWGQRDYCYVGDSYVHGIMYGEAVIQDGVDFKPIVIR